YLGGGGGTTASYVADVARVVYAVEFARRPARRLLDVAADRPGLMPVVEDARRPERYRAFVEEVDFLYQDVATRGQADVALRNRDYLRDGGVAWLCVKARSEDVTREPGEVYDDVVGELEGSFDVERVVDLEPFYDDHAVVVASKL
ncbi:MAG: fibrillarin-like rRNA/tRNA 2'-O-methyltransferase, partial [Halobacteriota archaeon]